MRNFASFFFAVTPNQIVRLYSRFTSLDKSNTGALRYESRVDWLISLVMCFIHQICAFFTPSPFVHYSVCVCVFLPVGLTFYAFRNWLSIRWAIALSIPSFVTGIKVKPIPLKSDHSLNWLIDWLSLIDWFIRHSHFYLRRLMDRYWVLCGIILWIVSWLKYVCWKFVNDIVLLLQSWWSGEFPSVRENPRHFPSRETTQQPHADYQRSQHQGEQAEVWVYQGMSILWVFDREDFSGVAG